jgi:hypothetical protein
MRVSPISNTTSGDPSGRGGTRTSIWRGFMSAYSPELITIMRNVLEELMTRVPLELATNSTKAHLAEVILKTASQGETRYDCFMDAAVNSLPTIFSMFS